MKIHLIKHISSGDEEFDIHYYEDQPDPVSPEERKHLVLINVFVWLAPVCIAVLDQLLK